MRADDPRHGTIAGWSFHQRTGFPMCGSCRRAKMRYEKSRLLGRPLKVPTLGSQRRIQALRALGWSLAEIAREGGWVSGHAAFKYALTAETITRTSADRIAAVYDRLSMTPATGPCATRVRNHAARSGWPPPLAWDDPDDPDERPQGWQYRPSTRRDDLEGLVDRGAGITEACAVLNISKKGVERWCDRNGCRDLYIALCGREDVMRQYRNQWTKPGAGSAA